MKKKIGKPPFSLSYSQKNNSHLCYKIILYTYTSLLDVDTPSRRDSSAIHLIGNLPPFRSKGMLIKVYEFCLWLSHFYRWQFIHLGIEYCLIYCELRIEPNGVLWKAIAFHCRQCTFNSQTFYKIVRTPLEKLITDNTKCLRQGHSQVVIKL